MFPDLLYFSNIRNLFILFLQFLVNFLTIVLSLHKALVKLKQNWSHIHADIISEKTVHVTIQNFKLY